MPDIEVCPTIVSRLKEKGADPEARTITEAIASLDRLVIDNVDDNVLEVTDKPGE